MTPSTVHILFSLTAAAALGACERHDWEDTKVLFQHGEHGEGHGSDGDAHADATHGENEALPDTDHSSDPDTIGAEEEHGEPADH